MTWKEVDSGAMTPQSLSMSSDGRVIVVSESDDHMNFSLDYGSTWLDEILPSVFPGSLGVPVFDISDDGSKIIATRDFSFYVFTANIPANGTCGTANNKTYPYSTTGYAPDTQCAVGTPSNTAFPGYGRSVTWTCSGKNGGTASTTCTASRASAPINGTCGSAARSYAYNVTSYSGYSQCANGSPSTTAFPNPGSSVSWTCSGQNGGSASTTCTATRAATPIAGSCGTANNKTYAYNVTSYGSDTQCSSGSSSNTAFPGQGSVVAWTCSGTNGGEARSCAAGRNLAPINGTCGSAARSYAYNVTSYSGYSQCANGSPSTTAFPNPGSSVSWTCSGQNGGSASTTCTATRAATPIAGSCGTANNKTYAYNVTAYSPDTQCSSGSSSNTAFPGQGSVVAWTCSGTNGGEARSCAAGRNLAPINGSCGTAARSYAYNVTSYSGYSQCANGSPSTTAFPNPGSSVSWTCSGQNGGSASTTCTATRAATPVAGACGTANNKTYYTETRYAPDTQCATGSPSTTAFPEPGKVVAWTCSGTNGGEARSCAAGKFPADGVCGSMDLATVPIDSLNSNSSGLCSSGSVVSFKKTYDDKGDDNGYFWRCTNGGMESACIAFIPVYCGTANNKTYPYYATSFETDTLCYSGYTNDAVFPGQGQTVKWICRDRDAIICTAKRDLAPSVAGSCGTANNKTYAYNVTAYSPDTQCSSGSSSNTAFPAQGQVVAWTCSGQNGGETRSCAAGRNLAPIAGACGPAATTYSGTATAYSGAQCSSGTASNTAFPAAGSSISWTCSGQNGGSASTTCTATRNAAIPSLDSVLVSMNIPSTMVIGQKYNVSITMRNTGSLTWSESVAVRLGGVGDGTMDTGKFSSHRFYMSGSAANGQQYTFNFEMTPTMVGTFNPRYKMVRDSVAWFGAMASPIITVSAAPVNGVCGPAATTYSGTATAYSGAQCSSGTASNTAFPAVGSSVSWTCSGTNGGNPSPTCTASRSKANSINLTLFKNAFDLLPTDTKSGSEDQCLWCEWYEKNTLVSGINETGLGKAGSLGFSFYYTDNINYRLKTVSLLVNTTNSTTGGVEITVPRNSDPANTILFGESLAPYVKVDNTVSALTLDTANNTIKIPYNGNTYYWFIKVTNTNNDDSGWVSATGKQITTPDHKWPTVAIQPATSEIIIGANNQFCSTSSFSSTDPCYSTCWKGTGTPSLSDLTDKNKWKCSVCYSTTGTPMLCQDKSATTFNWQDGGTMVFPDTSKKPSWWQYTQNNGREAMNPIVRPVTFLARIKLKITGSDCPFGGTISGGKINPTWKEGN